MVNLGATLAEQFLDVAVGIRPKRGCQRTATTMTSGGKRKPAKADPETSVERGR